ncbi:hypothetical protein HanRHA438_Chr16g0771901 [Helianthus annuus]|nr:hypothetical protein HanRHA438_Chr16g0771901 [Helianthus annuus]
MSNQFFYFTFFLLASLFVFEIDLPFISIFQFLKLISPYLNFSIFQFLKLISPLSVYFY